MSNRDLFVELAASLPVDADAIRAWFDQATTLGDAPTIERLSRAYGWATGQASPRHLNRSAIDYLERTRSPRGFAVDGMRFDLALDGLETSLDAIVTSTEAAVAALLQLHDPSPDGWAGTIRRRVPEWRALTGSRPTMAVGEHGPSHEHPLLEHLAERTLGRSLRALENGARSLFPASENLGDATFSRHRDAIQQVEAAGLLPAVRGALLFLDFSKGGTREQRAEWESAGIDLSVHNVASRQIVAASNRLGSFGYFSSPGRRELALALIECHGTVGQIVRGESTWEALGPVVRALRVACDSLGSDGLNDAALLTCEALHLVNVCDTSAVRFDLWSDELARRFGEVELVIRRALADGTERLWDWESARFAGSAEWLADRLARLRAGRIARGEPRHETERTVASLSDETIDRLVDRFRHTQVWYGEAATSGLRPLSQLKVLTIGMASVPGDNLHHVNLAPLMHALNDGSRAADYRVRLVDTVLEQCGIDDLLDGVIEAGPLIAFETLIGGQAAGELTLKASPEADALLTLLPIYETKNSAAFHRTLKEMCDLYGLRKDEFDRVANEGLYLEHMNAARSDKERMLDWCIEGEIIEVGPGGGVVLDLLEERYPESRIVGLDISAMVCDALRARREAEGRDWHVVEADAFDLPEHVRDGGASTIVFCSVLHEIYSYLPYPRDTDGPKFQLESVRDLLRASWRALEPGGRIVIRDGIKPPPGERLIRFKDPAGPEFLELFAEQFEGRDIEYEWMDEITARLSTPDAMEFLYCYTWGPASFPYEVREQYGILEYDAYVEAICEWVDDLEGSPRVVELPESERSYLQPGYIDGLAPKVDFLDADGEPVALPDSNCLIVIEKG